MCLHFAQFSGSLFLTQRIFEAVNPVRAGLAVISISLLAPTLLVISSHSFAVRWSHQIIEGRMTSQASSSITSPCICPEIPRPLISSPATPESLTTFAIVSIAASRQSSGFCSAHPLCGVYKGYSLDAEVITVPFSSNKTVLVAEVPKSIPIK